MSTLKAAFENIWRLSKKFNVLVQVVNEDKPVDEQPKPGACQFPEESASKNGYI